MPGGTAEAVAMPQVRRGRPGSGLVVPGVYAALLADERATYERRGGERLVIDGVEIGKKVRAGVDEHGKEGFSTRSAIF